MKITPAVLKALGAKKSGNQYTIQSRGVSTVLTSTLNRTTDNDPVWHLDGVAGGHYVTDVEDIFAFVYLDGFERGREAKLEEIKDVVCEVFELKEL